MKRLKIFLSLTALMLGLGGAVAAKIATMPKAIEQTYDWVGEGPNHSGPLMDKTIEEAQSAYGCSAPSTNLCATGVAADNSSAQIFRGL